MSVITGTAKKFDGTAIDYVSLFNWRSGQCVAQIVPNSNGDWTYTHFDYLTLGITYITDGCQPITHGSYNFAPEFQIVTKGFISMTYLLHGTRAAPQLDVRNLTNSEWVGNFGQTKNLAFLYYNLLTYPGEIPALVQKEKQVQFDPRWVLEFTAFADPENYLYESIKFLDEDNEIVFQLVISGPVGSDVTSVQYGIGSLTFAPQVGSSKVFPLGNLTFTDTQFLFTNKKDSNYIGSFSLNVDVTRIKSMLVTYEASINAIDTESGAWLKILNRA